MPASVELTVSGIVSFPFDTAAELTAMTTLPAYARIAQYQEAKEAIALGQMAMELLPTQEAEAYVATLSKRVPILAAPQPSKVRSDTAETSS
jgi:hypothetical protein